jgi:hypothetical protein
MTLTSELKQETETKPQTVVTKAPNFFVCGTVKAGTTSLYNYLQQHPEVYMSPIKEPHHFATDLRVSEFNPFYAKNLKTDITEDLAGDLADINMIAAIVQSRPQYLELFRDVKDEKAIGEVSTSYMYSAAAANEIFKYNPKAKIILSLRNPISRAYSHYLMNYRSGAVRGQFHDELVADINRQPKGWGLSRLYLDHGYYYQQVKRYFDLFPREQILVLIFDELSKNPDAVMKKVYDFLGVSSDFKSQTDVIHNKAKIPVSGMARMIINQQTIIKIAGMLVPKKIRRYVLSKLYTSKNLPEFKPATKELLKQYYRDDIMATSQLIGRDLSNWLD